VVEENYDGYDAVCAGPEGRWLAQTEGSRYVPAKSQFRQESLLWRKITVQYGRLTLSTTDNAKDTLCRNVLIYGNCRYEDQGCSFNHEPNSIHGSQAELYVLSPFYDSYPGAPKGQLVEASILVLVALSFGSPVVQVSGMGSSAPWLRLQ
jgi:hypothetical protein